MSSEVETSRFSFQSHNQGFLQPAHEATGWQATTLGMTGERKKNREENKFSSRVEVRVVTPKAFGAVDQAWGVNASFSSLIFSLLLSFSSPSN